MKLFSKENIKAAIAVLAVLFVVSAACAVSTMPQDKDRLIEKANKHFSSAAEYAKNVTDCWNAAKQYTIEAIGLDVNPSEIDFEEDGGKEYVVFESDPDADRIEITDPAALRLLKTLRQQERKRDEHHRLYESLMADAYNTREEAMHGAFLSGVKFFGVLLLICCAILTVQTYREKRRQPGS